jgi:hypothetical protein
MKNMPLALAAAALTAGFLSFGGAQAANVMTGSAAPGMTSTQDGNIQLADWWHHHHHGGSRVVLGFGLFPFLGGGYGYGYPGYGYGYPGYGYGYAGYGYGYPAYGYGYPGYGYGYRPYRRAYYGGGSAHVRWCMNRYRTYDPRSNTFIGYDGDRHRCRSPYRY